MHITKVDNWRGLTKLTTNPACIPNHTGDLDFAFVVHPRDFRDIFAAFPDLESLPEEEALRRFQTHPALVISPITIANNGHILRGELLSVPFRPVEFRRSVPRICNALEQVIAYCESRKAKSIGLGGLLPFICRHGIDLVDYCKTVGITTGHSYTAHVISEQVRMVERALGRHHQLAIVGAAGSTGKATIKSLCLDGRPRKLLLLDLPEKGQVLEWLGNELRQQFGHEVEISFDLGLVRECKIVVTVTNSMKAILQPRHLSPGAVVIDDAQPPNVTAETAQAAGALVIKCLAEIPGMICPFDFDLFKASERAQKQNYTFTCLAETALLAASGWKSHFTIGDPTSEQIKLVAEMEKRFGYRVAPFHSFPEVGAVCI